MSERFGFRKMEFRLQVSEDWPPVSSETLWVETLDEGNFRVDNPPYFVRDLAVDDVVEGAETDGPFLTFIEKVASGGHSTVWVITLDKADKAWLIESMRSEGCFVEVSPWPSLMTLDVPTKIALEKVRRILQPLVSESFISVVEGCIA